MKLLILLLGISLRSLLALSIENELKDEKKEYLKEFAVSLLEGLESNEDIQVIIEDEDLEKKLESFDPYGSEEFYESMLKKVKKFRYQICCSQTRICSHDLPILVAVFGCALGMIVFFSFKISEPWSYIFVPAVMIFSVSGGIIFAHFADRCLHKEEEVTMGRVKEYLLKNAKKFLRKNPDNFKQEIVSFIENPDLSF